DGGGGRSRDRRAERPRPGRGRRPRRSGTAARARSRSIEPCHLERDPRTGCTPRGGRASRQPPALRAQPRGRCDDRRGPDSAGSAGGPQRGEALAVTRLTCASVIAFAASGALPVATARASEQVLDLTLEVGEQRVIASEGVTGYSEGVTGVVD